MQASTTTLTGSGWPLAALSQALQARLPSCRVELVAELDSSNSELMRRARSGRMEPVLLVVEQQTAGRGRLGRQWHSAGPSAGAPAGLTFSLGLPLAPPDWSGLSLAVGLSLARNLHPALRLKWPNDLWFEERKLGGILIEISHSGNQAYAVIGVGLNLQAPAVPGLDPAPAWLAELLPDLDGPQALLRLASPLLADLQRFEAEGFAPLRSEFDARDALRGRVVGLSDASQGLASGVDAAGALLLQTAGGRVKVTGSEVSVRPLNPRQD